MDEDGATAPVPCRLCRRRKVKCDKKQPGCSFCLKAGVPCKYDDVRRQPGLRAGYVQQLDSRVLSLETQLTTLHRDLAMVRAQTHVSSSDFTQGRTDAHAYSGYGGRPAAVASESSNAARTHRTGSISNSASPASSGRVQLLQSPEQVVVAGLCDQWFKLYHPWLPLLHHQSCAELGRTANFSLTSAPLVLKAIVAGLLPRESDHAISPAQVQEWPRLLSEEIVLRATSSVSPDALQAMLIQAIVAFGDGELQTFWNLIAVCKRLSMQLGLHDLVVNVGLNYGQASIMPPRMLTVPPTYVDLEARVRSYWLAEVLDSVSTVGVSWNTSISVPETDVLIPTGEDYWSLEADSSRLYPFEQAGDDSSFSMYVQVISAELSRVHIHHQQRCDLSVPEARAKRQNNCVSLHERLQVCLQRTERFSISANSPQHSPPSKSTSVSHNIALTQCILDVAIITIYQRMIYESAEGSSASGAVWHDAAAHCLASCDHIVEVLRLLPDHILECPNPQLIVCEFVAARFYLIYARASRAALSAKIYILLYSMRCCQGRWRLASRLLKVVDAAIIAFERLDDGLPVQFWDLQYAWQDIDHALTIWANGSDS